MTADERFERLEHYTAGLAEERRKDREEYKTLWRDTQRQLNEVSARLVQLSEEDSRLGDRIAQLAEESRAANAALQERISSLVSAMGEFIRQQGTR